MWQDFQFACGVYPAFDAFVQSVTAEAEDNVKRLRHHPSLALFCGNNEGASVTSTSSAPPSRILHNAPCTLKYAYVDYQMVLQWGGAHACRRSVGASRA